MQLLSFLQLLRVSKGALALILLASAIGGLGGIALLALIHEGLTRHAYINTKIVLAFAGLCLLMPLMRATSEILLSNSSETSLYNLRVRLCQQIISTPLRRLEEIGEPTLLAALTADVFAISNVLNRLPSLIVHVFIVVGCLVYLAWLSWFPFLFLIGMLIVAILTIHFMQLHGSRIQARAREELDVLHAHYQSMIKGVKELKLRRDQREYFQKTEFAGAARSFKQQNIRAVVINALSGGWASLLLYGALGVLIFALPSTSSLSPETATGYVMTILYMSIPVADLIVSIPELSYANVCVRRLGSLDLALAPDQSGASANQGLAPFHNLQSLELIGVTHSYHDDLANKFVLGPIDLRMVPGELIFITGGNGSGKTTLAKLLTGLYAPETGEIRFNNQPVTDQNRENYRQHFSAIFSDFWLFRRLVGADLPELDRKAEFYLKRFQLDRKVKVNQGTFSMIDLSQGQRKRLALLAAYLENRPIYLFDEWAADQEPFFREYFYETLLPELKLSGKLVIVISHDDRYYEIGDRVIKLEYGKLAYDRQKRSQWDGAREANELQVS